MNLGNLSSMFIEKILEVKDKITKNGNQETEISNKSNLNQINDKESKKEENIVSNQSNVISKNRIQKWQKVTRKMAHFTIYAIGGFVMYCITAIYSENEKVTLRKILITVSFGVIYAIFDEIHQFFSDGRTPKVFDVIIDTAGIISGLVIAIVAIFILSKTINYIYERRKN
ncbi:MAG: VanZ family protein [Clostridia bacterium]|nr:VanZ family protein [Clostridia bacterium]